ncbi:MFS transporter [Streptomyces chattanoogensis]
MCIGFFMSLLDGSIVNVAIPTLIHSIDASYDQVLWVIDGYMLVFSVLLISTGRLGDVFGYRRLYVIGIITFTLASALCGLANSPAGLLTARALQGLGGALLFPQVISSILTIFPPRLRGRAFAVGNWIGFVFQLGMIGIMFVLVLYLQMARGYSALETGLLVLPNAVLTAVGSVYAGRLSDRFGGKHVLMTGMVLLAVGLLTLVAMTGPTSSAASLLPGLVIIGIASGATFAPLQQATMDGVDPQLAGAASGVSSTIRQIGGVLGTAVLGALLSARLSSTLRSQAEKRAGELPENLRAQFISDSAAAAQHYSPPAPPGGLNPATAGLYERVTADTFATGFVDAMRTTLVACAMVLVAAALFCFLFSPRKKPMAESAESPDSAETRHADTAS